MGLILWKFGIKPQKEITSLEKGGGKLFGRSHFGKGGPILLPYPPKLIGECPKSFPPKEIIYEKFKTFGNLNGKELRKNCGKNPSQLNGLEINWNGMESWASKVKLTQNSQRRERIKDFPSWEGNLPFLE